MSNVLDAAFRSYSTLALIRPSIETEFESRAEPHLVAGLSFPPARLLDSILSHSAALTVSIMAAANTTPTPLPTSPQQQDAESQEWSPTKWEEIESPKDKFLRKLKEQPAVPIGK